MNLPICWDMLKDGSAFHQQRWKLPNSGQLLSNWRIPNFNRKTWWVCISNYYINSLGTLLELRIYQYVPVGLGESLGPFEGWGKERGTLCPLVWGGTPFRWPCAESYPAPLLYWSSRRRWAVGSRSKCYLQNGGDSKVDNVKELSWLVKSAMPLGKIWRVTNIWANMKIWKRQSLFNWSKGHLLISCKCKVLWFCLAEAIKPKKEQQKAACSSFVPNTGVWGASSWFRAGRCREVNWRVERPLISDWTAFMASGWVSR